MKMRRTAWAGALNLRQIARQQVRPLARDLLQVSQSVGLGPINAERLSDSYKLKRNFTHHHAVFDAPAMASARELKTKTI